MLLRPVTQAGEQLTQTLRLDLLLFVLDVPSGNTDKISVNALLNSTHNLLLVQVSFYAHDASITNDTTRRQK